MYTEGNALFWMIKARSEDERAKIVCHFITEPATWQRKACEWLQP
jgi:hypothetical protein